MNRKESNFSIISNSSITAKTLTVPSSIHIHIFVLHIVVLVTNIAMVFGQIHLRPSNVPIKRLY